MKHILFFIIIMISLQASAQKSDEVASLKSQIDSLEQRLEETNYVRIPKQDFEKNLQNSVENEVSDSIIKWIGFLAILIGLLGFFIAGYFKNQIREQVIDNLKSFNEMINQLRANEKEINAKQDTVLQEIKQEFLVLKEEQKNFMISSEAEIHKIINQTLSSMWDDIVDSKMKIAEEKNFKGDELIIGINSLLENKGITLRMEKKIALIDILMRCYYYMPGKAKYKHMIELLRKYETDTELSLMPSTYFNAAIAFINNYELYGNRMDRDTCIDCCDKSLNLLPDYGLPFAIKLEVSMIDYKKAFDENEKKAALENINRTFNDIKNNQSHALCYEIISRLNEDWKVAYLQEYINNLEISFADNLLELRERVCSAIILNNALDEDEYKDMFNKILNDCLLKIPNINGEWVPSKTIKSGIEINQEQNSPKLFLKDFEYALSNNESEENGLVHFLPYSKTGAINFYKQNGETFIKTHTWIFKIEENKQLTVCYGNSVDQRPEDFSSTPANQNSLVIYDLAT